jgi:3-oxoacyl-[acyl-carrier protein] reductase
MVETAKELYGAIDVLINNAAIAQQKLFTDITEEEWDSIFAVNVKGVYNCCKAVVPHMVSQKDGVILNISSVWGMVGASCEVHYSATKAAVIGFSKALAKELGLSGIRVNCIAPGVIDTDMNAGLSPDTLAQLKGETPLARIGTSKDIAALALFLASSEASFITGQVISSNGGFVI